MSDVRRKFAVCAPGKVILFGEHAVVHNVPAIAAAVALHTYFVVESTATPFVEIDFPAVKYHQKWAISDLPWADATQGHTARALPLNAALQEKLEPLLSSTKGTFDHAAASAFLYLFLHLGSRQANGFHIRSLSTLPVGAGLGSSASFCVCLATTLLYLGGHISEPKLGSNDGKHVESTLRLIDNWAYIGECCVHGNPSGIDNIVATRGGAVYFQRRPGGPPAMIPYHKFPPLDLILTNTRIPRRTSALVAGVAKLKAELPAVIDPIMESVKALVMRADDFIRRYADGSTSSKEVSTALYQLVQINHGLLVALGVSHPALERIREVTDTLHIGTTKLTGAGGGGCTITLMNEGGKSSVMEMKAILGPSFEVIETVLGGPGVGIAKLDADLDISKWTTNSLRNMKWCHW